MQLGMNFFPTSKRTLRKRRKQAAYRQGAAQRAVDQLNRTFDMAMIGKHFVLDQRIDNEAFDNPSSGATVSGTETRRLTMRRSNGAD